MPADDPDTRLVLLSDEPIESHRADRLGMEGFRGVITGTVLGTVGPFTIGVYGRWGEGKTSLLRAAESRLRQCATDATATPAQRPGEPDYPYVVPVWFNPWQYESEEHPLVPLVAEIERAVTAALLDAGAIRARYGEQTVKILKGIGLAGLSLLRSASARAKVKAGIPGTASGELDIGIDGKNFVEGLERAWERAQKEQKSAWHTLVDQSTYLTIFDRLRALYAELDTARPGSEKRIPRIAVFIDDLDRCQADKAFELIESIKLVLGQKGFIFILALDKGIVDAYVEGLWKERLKDRYGQEAARYLDKIVQLPLYLRTHDTSFTPFVDGLLTRLREGGVPDETVKVFEGVKDHLGLATEYGPRALVRRINTLLVDQRLRPPVLESDHEEVRDLTPAHFLGLCLVQRTLLDYLDHGVVKAMSKDDAFCTQMANVWTAAQQAGKADQSNPVSAMYDFLDALRDKNAGEDESKATSAVPGRALRGIDQMHTRWSEFLLKLDPHTPCEYILGTDDGVRWLSSRHRRDLVTNFVSARPAPPPIPQPAHPTATAPAVSPVSQAASPSPKTAEAFARGPASDAGQLADTPELREQIALIERQVRRALDLGADAPIDAAAWGKVQELNFISLPLSDLGLAWLSREQTGLKGLTTLDLSNTKVTDAGARALADPQTGLKGLTTLNLWNTQVTDAGARALADSETGLKGLTTLDLGRTAVTDAGARTLADPQTGLKGLTTLSLSYTKVTDAGVRALADPHTGLKGLTTLNLWSTQVTDEGARALAAPPTGLKGLTRLDLGWTAVTDAGARALAAPQTGLKGLTTLNLWNTQVTDEGARALADPQAGLKGLTTLYLWNTQVTDAGVKALKARWPGISIRR